MAIKIILLATDMEPESVPALDYAFALGEELGALVHVLHAYPPVVVPDSSGSGSIPYEALHERARARLEALTVGHQHSPSRGRCLVDMGDPRSVILEMARAVSADLIVMGTHARQGMQRLLLGSVAEAVLREAPVPVLIVGRSARTISAPCARDHEGPAQALR